MTRLPDATSWLPNPADSYTEDHPPTRAELDDFCDRLKDEMILYAKFRYNSTAFKDIAPIDEDDLCGYLKDMLSDATHRAWKELS